MLGRWSIGMFSLGGRHSIQAVRASDGAHLSSGFYHTHGTMPRERMTEAEMPRRYEHCNG
jgi:hypothetical protein